MSKFNSKSWKVTAVTLFIAVLLPIINGQLPEANQISDQMVWSVMSLFGISAAAGTVNSIVKRREATKQHDITTKQNIAINDIKATAQQVVAARQTREQSEYSIKTPKAQNPNIVSQNGWYGTSFRYDKEHGNYVPHGEPFLWVQINGETTFVQGHIKGSDGRILQLEHTGTSTNKWDNILRFELYGKQDGVVVPFGIGEYELYIESDRGTSYLQKTTDKFKIL